MYEMFNVMTTPQDEHAATSNKSCTSNT